ncbi:MAG: NUDIX domain-containing protein [Ignavibacteriales bacterium]|jgi:8-oxo-dGTP pyrophosphatase MutT (NUDIX family)|nr:MAG: NUDIX domain-containing protein [Ignavibacteriales bacterium]
MKTKPSWYYNQSAVIPFRLKSGKLEVLLVTSRIKKNWIIPKGIIEIGLSPQQSAVKEALEEAGVSGNLIDKLFDEYTYKKWGGKCRVKVYLLQVEKVHKNWDEKNTRERQWLSINKAIKKINKKELVILLTLFSESYLNFLK